MVVVIAIFCLFVLTASNVYSVSFKFIESNVFHSIINIGQTFVTFIERKPIQVLNINKVFSCSLDNSCSKKIAILCANIVRVFKVQTV